MQLSQKKELARQNDAFRQLRGMLGGQIMFTPGVFDTGMTGKIHDAVMNYTDFNEDNDLFGEHDFGAFDFPGVGKVFWKIDYYNEDYSAGSEDPCDPAKTRRILTVMLASEY